jgi:heme O synthase-like polyprenyltransferase
VAFLAFAIQFSRHLTAERARHLFIASIVYLPLLLGLLVIDKVK